MYSHSFLIKNLNQKSLEKAQICFSTWCVVWCHRTCWAGDRAPAWWWRRIGRYRGRWWRRWSLCPWTPTPCTPPASPECRLWWSAPCRFRRGSGRSPCLRPAIAALCWPTGEAAPSSVWWWRWRPPRPPRRSPASSSERQTRKTKHFTPTVDFVWVKFCPRIHGGFFMLEQALQISV